MTTRKPADRMRSWRLFLVCFAMLIVSLDQYIVVVALPDIGRALGYTAHTLQLVVSAYAVASSGFLLVGGRAADLLGRRRMLATGLVLYALASVAGGLATGPATQLAARVVQGLGGALVFPATLAVVTTTYAEGRERNRALGLWGAAGACANQAATPSGAARKSRSSWPLRWSLLASSTANASPSRGRSSSIAVPLLTLKLLLYRQCSVSSRSRERHRDGTGAT